MILPRSCTDLAMILTSVPCIMISHDLDKVAMINHDLARLTMILASVACLQSLGNLQIRTRGSPFQFFRTVRLFFRNLFCVKRVPLQVFWYFAANWKFKKPKRSPFRIFGWDFFWMITFRPKHVFFQLLKTLRCLSLRYSADFSRSRLVFIKTKRLWGQCKVRQVDSTKKSIHFHKMQLPYPHGKLLITHYSGCFSEWTRLEIWSSHIFPKLFKIINNLNLKFRS